MDENNSYSKALTLNTWSWSNWSFAGGYDCMGSNFGIWWFDRRSLIGAVPSCTICAVENSCKKVSRFKNSQMIL